MAERKLTLKQRIFIQEYLIDMNGSAAALRAGYSKRNPDDIAIQLLRKTHVQAALTESLAARERRTGITTDKVLADIDLIRQDAMRVADDEMVDRTAALKACELLGKHLKMFTDKVEHSGTVDMIGEFKINLVKP